MDSSPCERVAAFFSGDSHDLAVRALRSYYGPGRHYTGSAFDRLISTTPADSFTSDDILAVSMLSVSVPPRAALFLIGSADVSDLLSRIPLSASVWDHPELLDRDGDAWKLWDLVDGLDDVGQTTASKLLAAKRPKLIPIYDQYVDAALRFDGREWAFWQNVVADVSVRELLTAIANARFEAKIPASVSVLRVIDVVVWMRQHGWTMHNDDKCSIGCDFDGI